MGPPPHDQQQLPFEWISLLLLRLTYGGCPAKTSTFFYYGCRNRQRHGNDDCVFPLVNKDRLERAIINPKSSIGQVLSSEPAALFSPSFLSSFVVR